MRRHLLLVPLVLALAACNVTGGSMNTVIEVDESGYFEISVGFADDPNPNDCSIEGAPAGTNVTTDRRSGETWCNYQMPFQNLQELSQLYDGLFADAVQVRCLAFDAEKLIFDVDLISDEVSDDSSSIPLRLTVPGPIGMHNADEADGNVLTWFLTSFVGTRPLKVNVPDDGLCPTHFFEVHLVANDDGTGTATLTIPFSAAANGLEALVGTLRGSGWELDGPGDPSQVVFKARRLWDSEESFAALADAIPGFAGSGSTLRLALSEDAGTGFLQFDFGGRLDAIRYQTFWSSYSSETQVAPLFRFVYSAPGTLETAAGSWTDPVGLQLVWDPIQVGGPFPLQAISVLAPELNQEVSDETASANLDGLAVRFVDEIPVGQLITQPSLIQRGLLKIFSPGGANNLTNGVRFACGDYQTMVLRWLESIRTHPDPAVRAELGGLDFGPIQAYNGGHQAVVLFRRGTDWRETGIALDPWPTQRPQVFTMEEWQAKFSWGVGVGEGGPEYPHMFGNPSGYRGTDLPPERLHPSRIGINSPVDVLITAADGRRLGRLADGSFVNEIEHADFYPTPHSESEYQWYFGLPEGDYEVQFTGSGDGDMHILFAGGEGELLTYGPQAMHAGEVAGLSLRQVSSDPALILPGGESVGLIEVTEENIDTIDFGESLGGSSAIPAGPARLVYLGALALLTIVPAGGLWLLVVRRIGRRKG